MVNSKKDKLELPDIQECPSSTGRRKAMNDGQGFVAGLIISQNLQNDSIFGFLADICSPTR